MAEPSLSEITNMAVDPERGTGTPAVVYDNRQLVGILNQAANVKAEYDWKKYNTFLGNLKDVYKDMNEIAKTPIMSQDTDYFRGQMGEIVKEISKDPKAFFGGGPKYNEILGKVSKLQQEATQSKQDNVFDTAHRQYFYRNPDLDTPENRELIGTFANAKLGVRQPYTMQLPGMFDPNEMAKVLNASVKAETPFSNLTPDQQFYETGVNTTYDPDKYRKLAEAMYAQTDKRGVPLSTTIQKRFDALPKELKSQFKDAKEFFVEDLMARILPGSSTKEMKSNPNYLEKERLAETKRHNKSQEGLGWYNAETSRISATKSDGTVIANSITGNALNGIPIAPGTKDGELVLDSKGSEYLGQIQNLFGKEDVLINPVTGEPSNAKVKVKGGVVNAIQIHGKWYDRQEIENLQKKRDTEAKGQERHEYPIEQAYFGDQSSGTGSSAKDQDLNFWKPKEVTGDTDISGLSDGSYLITTGRNKGRTVIIKNGKPESIK